MSGKHRALRGSRPSDPRGKQANARGRRAPEASAPGGPSRLSPGPYNRMALAVSAVAVVIVAVLGVGFASGALTGSPSGTNSEGVTVQASGGEWTNITPDRLATMLDHKDFTLLNVKTPYIGEISGTDLYIPYDQVAARAAELPADKASRLVVYCRSGHESAIAAQALIDLGYTNIDNLDGGMDAWTASGRQLVNLGRTS